MLGDQVQQHKASDKAARAASQNANSASAQSKANAGAGAQGEVGAGAQGEAFERDGIVYRETPEGYILEDAQNCTAHTYRVIDGTVGIGKLAFAGNIALEMIAFPNSLKWIGDSAFSACENLTAAVLPPALERIDDWAFFGSSVEMLHIPSSCTHIGSCALVADGGGRAELWSGGRQLNLAEVDIAPENPAFYLVCDVLCARGQAQDGGDVALLYIGPATSVTLPAAVTEIGAMAFANVSTLDELVMHGRVRKLGASALALSEPPRHIVIGLEPPVSGHAALDLRPPHNEAGLAAINRMFKTDTIDPWRIMEAMDRATLNQNDHFARYRTMAERLANPLFMGDATREQFTSFLRSKSWTVCELFRERSFTEGFRMLVETGVFDGDTLTQVIDRAVASSDTALAAQLLQLKREQGPAASATDFEL